MATAQSRTKKDVIKSARKKPVEPTKPAEVGKGDLEDPYSQASIDAGSLDNANYKKVADKGDQSAFDQPSTMRQDFFNELKKRSRLGSLTPEVYEKAKEQLGKYEGVSGEDFESAMSKNLIRPSNFATAAPTESKEEAAQNVMFQRQYGTGLGTLKAMQDPNYELGSGSALRQPARSIGPASGKFRRAARRLRRQGYGSAAQQMAMAGEMARMSEPSIDTPALRGQRMAQRIVAGREAQKQDRLAAKTSPAPANNLPDLRTPMAPVSPLDKTRNQQKLGSTKREGQRI